MTADPSPNDRRAELAREFERHRPHLRAVAYRMLGSVAEADDAVQEAWLRLDRSPPAADGERDLRGWLTVVTGRICLDVLRARRSRRERSTDEVWLPEPIVEPLDDERDPERAAVLADSIGLALLVVLEELTPTERLAFVLHDVFAVPFEEVARIVDRSPAAARQLASRARRRVRGSSIDADSDLPTQRRVVEAFLAAARAGDFEALLQVLAPDVVLRVDAGARARLDEPVVVGAEAAATVMLTRGRPFAPLARPAMVNGTIGAVARAPGGQTLAVLGFGIARGRITSVDIVADPDKLDR